MSGLYNGQSQKVNTNGVMLEYIEQMEGSPHPFGMMFSPVLSIEIGVITAFGGAIGNIPPGWFLCDGTNGTPDLRNEFIVATGPIFSVGDEGGNILHDHDFTGDGHFHQLGMGPNLQIGANFAPGTMPAVARGTTDTKIIAPPYYALAYIQYRGP